MKSIEFCASVTKVQTLADNGIRLTLDLPEDAIMQMAELAACKRHGVYLAVTCEAVEQGDDGTESDNRKIHI